MSHHTPPRRLPDADAGPDPDATAPDATRGDSETAERTATHTGSGTDERAEEAAGAEERRETPVEAGVPHPAAHDETTTHPADDEATVPHPADDDDPAMGPEVDARLKEGEGTNPTEVWKSSKRVRTEYRKAIQYSLDSLTQWVQRYGDDDTVLVFLGDHQPVPTVTGGAAPARTCPSPSSPATRRYWTASPTGAGRTGSSPRPTRRNGR